MPDEKLQGSRIPCLECIHQCRQALPGGGLNGFLGDTWSWNGKHWTQVQDIGPEPRTFAAMAYDSNRSRTVLFGGATQNTLLGDTWELYEHS
jgi:hypothetical protein